MDWNKYGAYRVFDEFVETFFIGRKSFITTHDSELDLEGGFDKIYACYVQDFDASKGKTYDQKLQNQFAGAGDNEKLIFTNLEYLWAMPVANIHPATKQGYARRWYRKQARVGSHYFFEHRNDCVADPGMWNNRNKFSELCSLVYCEASGQIPRCLQRIM